MKQSKKAKSIFFTAVAAITMVGLYNAVVINADSALSTNEARFVKRLDESLGHVTPGRSVAGWKKLDEAQIQQVAQAPVVIEKKTPKAVVAEAPKFEPAVQETLELNLVEVVNPVKWQNGVAANQFRGALSTNEGMIESLNVMLPEGQEMYVSFAELNGNVFQYDYAGEIYSGMLFQVDQNSYMVTLTNGPLEGTRLRFSNLGAQEQQFQTEQALADAQIEAGSFGEEATQFAAMDQETQPQEIQTQVFNFNTL